MTDTITLEIDGKDVILPDPGIFESELIIYKHEATGGFVFYLEAEQVGAVYSRMVDMWIIHRPIGIEDFTELANGLFDQWKTHQDTLN